MIDFTHCEIVNSDKSLEEILAFMSGKKKDDE